MCVCTDFMHMRVHVYVYLYTHTSMFCACGGHTQKCVSMGHWLLASLLTLSGRGKRVRAARWA